MVSKVSIFKEPESPRLTSPWLAATRKLNVPGHIKVAVVTTVFASFVAVHDMQRIEVRENCGPKTTVRTFFAT